MATNLPVHDMDSFALPEEVDLYVGLLKRLLEDPENDELREWKSRWSSIQGPLVEQPRMSLENTQHIQMISRVSIARADE